MNIPVRTHTHTNTHVEYHLIAHVYLYVQCVLCMCAKHNTNKTTKKGERHKLRELLTSDRKLENSSTLHVFFIPLCVFCAKKLCFRLILFISYLTGLPTIGAPKNVPSITPSAASSAAADPTPVTLVV